MYLASFKIIFDEKYQKTKTRSKKLSAEFIIKLLYIFFKAVAIMCPTSMLQNNGIMLRKKILIANSLGGNICLQEFVVYSISE